MRRGEARRGETRRDGTRRDESETRRDETRRDVPARQPVCEANTLKSPIVSAIFAAAAHHVVAAALSSIIGHPCQSRGRRGLIATGH